MKKLVLCLFALIVLFSIQTVSGKSLTADISKATEQKMIDNLGLRIVPDNVSQFGLNRINFDALINTDGLVEGSGVKTLNSLMAGGTLNVSVDKQIVTLVYDELETSDPSGVVHWLGHVQGDPDSFVRLTIDSALMFQQISNGASANQMAGIIITNGKTIKLRPTGVADYHVLYEVNDENDNYLLKLDSKSKNETKARWLEAKGIQRDLLAEMPETSFKIGNRGSLTGLRRDLSHGEIGKLDVKSESDLKRAIDVLAPYYGLTGSEKFTFFNQSSTTQEDIYDLHQSINGIPIYGGDLRIFVSKASHKITQVLGGTVVDNGLPNTPLISEDDAKILALDYVAAKYEGTYSRFEALEARLIYSSAEVWARDRLRLNWEIAILRDGDPVNVLVDTDNGDIRVLETIRNLPPRAAVCTAGGTPDMGPSPPPPLFPHPTSCDPTEGSWMVIWDDGFCYQIMAGECDRPLYNVPRDTFIAAGLMWEGLFQDTGCCSMGVGGKYDIIVEVPHIVNPPSSPNMRSPYDHYATSTKTTIRIREDADATDTEAIGHEIGHALHYHFSPDTYNLGGQGTTETRKENAAVAEGIANVFSIIQINYNHNPKFSNADWVTYGYNLAIPRTYPSDFKKNYLLSDPTSNFPHTNGLILGHAFYRLVTDNNGVSFQQASILFGEAIKKLEDSNDNEGVSFYEMRQAMELAANYNQTYLHAVQDAWADVGIGNSAPCTLEAPYGPINGQLIGCIGGGWTQWSVYWGDACRSATTHYEFWFSQPLGSNYVLDSSMPASETTAVPIGLVYVKGAPARTKIKACDANQCSQLSSFDTVVSPAPGCHGGGNYD